MNRLPGALRQQLGIWAALLLLWALLVFALAGQLVLAGAVPWTEALTISLRDWLPWAPLVPIVAWLAAKFPLERGSLPLSVGVHLAACVLALLFCDLVSRHFFPLAGAPAGDRLGPGPGNPERLAGGRDGPPPFDQERPPPGFGPGPGGRPFEDIPPEERRREMGRGRGAPPPEERQAMAARPLIMRARFNLPIYWIIVSIVHALSYYRRAQERERRSVDLEARLATAKLEALRMQLQPHFLFNTLNAISTLVHKDPAAADEMIANLSELLRVTLDNSGKQQITLREELSFLDKYLEIQQVRFGERLRVERQIEAATLAARVPTLILQPLVENAIRHGIEPQPGAGYISISTRLNGGNIYLTVQDNGNGSHKPDKRGHGIGLSNTQARLEQLYGQRAKLVLSNSPAGTTVELALPFEESPAPPP